MHVIGYVIVIYNMDARTLCLDGALRRLKHTEVCIGIDIAHFLSLMYGFIVHQDHL